MGFAERACAAMNLHHALFSRLAPAVFPEVWRDILPLLEAW